jgi:competence protein ComEC
MGMTRSLGFRAPLLWLALPLMAGLAAGQAGVSAPTPVWLGGALMVSMIGRLCQRKFPWVWAPTILLTMVLAGLASYGIHRRRLKDWDQLPPREVRLSLTVDHVFASSAPKKASGLATVVRTDPGMRELLGQRLYYSLTLRTGESAPLRSAIIAATGVIASLPRHAPADTFEGYLAANGMNFRLTRGRVLREEKAATAYNRFCARAERRLFFLLGAGVEQKRPELTAVLRAMMLGEQHELNDEQKSLFRHSGTMHIFTISGLHIAVIAGGLQALLSLLRLPRLVQFLAGIIALWLYVEITGAASSALRAFAMVALVQASVLLRLPSNPVATLTASALLVLFVTPLQLFSASFQMSYGIVAALLLLGLPLAEAWQERWVPFRNLPRVTWRWWHRWIAEIWRWGTAAIGIGIASSLVGTVTGVLFFKLFTPGALLINLALIPLASLVILAGFLSLLGGLLGSIAASVLFNHAAVLLLVGIDFLVRFLLRLPAMWYEANFESTWTGGIAISVLVAVLLAGYALRWEKRWGGFWTPFIVVIVTLAFGAKFGAK